MDGLKPEGGMKVYSVAKPRVKEEMKGCLEVEPGVPGSSLMVSTGGELSH
jgi:hypothetical protein